MFNKKLPVPTDRVLLEKSDEKLETNSRETSELKIEDSSSGSGSADSVGGTAEMITLQKLGFDILVSASVNYLSKRLIGLKKYFDFTYKIVVNLESKRVKEGQRSCSTTIQEWLERTE